MAFKPEYPGADEYEVSPLPHVDIVWKDRVFLNEGRGLGVYALKGQTYSLGASIAYHGGRDDDDRLRGMGEIDATAQARVFGQIQLGRLSLGTTFARDLGEGEGSTLEFNASTPFALGQRWTLKPGIKATFADDDYMESWFGVSAPQAAASGLGRYRPDGGLMSAGVFLNTSYQLTQRWTVSSSLKLEKLMGDAADSPVVEQELQPSLGVTVGYRF